MEIVICRDAAEMGNRSAEEGAERIREALANRAAARAIFATGASQFEVLAALITQENVDWSRITGFHLDEYLGLDASHPASFRGYLKERLVDRVAFQNFHYVDGEADDPSAECERLGRVILEDSIDVAFVGIGENGHLAFNDPPADFDTEQPYLVVQLDEDCRRQQLGEGWFPTLEDVPKQAISMSIRQIMKSKTIICSVPDRRKAEAVRATIQGPVTPDVPASILQQHADCKLYLDTAAASLLKDA